MNPCMLCNATCNITSFTGVWNICNGGDSAECVSYPHEVACSLIGGGAAILFLLILVTLMAVTICCLAARLIRLSRGLKKDEAEEGEAAENAYPLALRDKADSNTSASPPHDTHSDGEKAGESKGKFELAKEAENEGEGTKKVPYYTEVVKIKKTSKIPTRNYNKLKHASESPAPPKSPTAAQPLEQSYSLLSASMRDVDTSSPPPLPPPISEDDLLQDAAPTARGEGGMGRREGDTGEAVYYNDTSALRSIDEDDEGEATDEYGGEKVQYANC